MNYRTKIKYMKCNILDSIILNTINWVSKNIKINKNKLKYIEFQILNNKSEYKGIFDPWNHNLITIYRRQHNNIIDLIDTVIHECIHAIQPIKKDYYRLLKKFNYNKHPFEIKANKISKKYRIKCWKDIKNKIKKLNFLFII